MEAKDVPLSGRGQRNAVSGMFPILQTELPLYQCVISSIPALVEPSTDTQRSEATKCIGYQ